ncbi:MULTISPECIES: FAD-dependent oxidoreductase [Streptomyces]|uniref:FAD-dependent oxidoreductase n=1 Tax=Streptomyces TaxID=1883 RepID=UPI000B9E8F48|nr:FAD-dependent oxidoreductase [Streptomyces kasugaensis]
MAETAGPHPAAAAGSHPAAAAGPLRVAVVGPFSGPRAAWGELLTRAADAHRDRGITWERHDDRGDAGRAAAVAEAVTGDGGYAAVVGHFNSIGAGHALPVYRDAGLPLLLPLATAPGLLRGGGGGALRWCPLDTGQPAALRRATEATGTPAVADDGTDYGRRLAERFRAAWRTAPPVRRDGPAALVVCGTHFGAAATARRLRTAGFAGRLLFTDDCAVAEFAGLLGADEARDARVVRLRGGPYTHVDAAFGCLVRALAGDPGARGGRLLAALRAHAGLAFDADGDPVDADSAAGWEVVPVLRAASPAAGPAPGPDVVVVGAGAVGAATAAHLAEAGLSVAMTAPGPGTASATDWSGGLVRAYEPDPAMRALAVRSHGLLWGNPAGQGAACGFRRTGSLVLLGAGDVEEAERGLAQLRDAGVTADLLGPAEVRDRWPDLAADGIAGAVWEPGGGYADPPATAAHYRTRALRYGATLLPGPVVALETHPRGVRAVTPAGAVTARCAVVAAGSGTPALLGDRLPVRPGRGAPRTKRIRYAFFDLGGRRLPAVSDLTTGMWGRPQTGGPAAGGHLTGRPVDEWDVPAAGGGQLTGEEIAHIRSGAVRRWPWIGQARYLLGRFGADLYHPDGPFLGPLPGEPRVVVAACWSGAGFKTAPGAAAEAAAAVRRLLRTDHADPTGTADTGQPVPPAPTEVIR